MSLSARIAHYSLAATLWWLPSAVVYAQDLDKPFGAVGLIELFSELFKFALFLIVVAAAIFIGIGAYFYFAAAGNAELAGRGKQYINQAIIGLVLGLIAWVLLNTINPQFTSGLHTPDYIPILGR